MSEIFDQPFDPNTEDLENETQPLDVVMQRAIDAMLYEMNICMPAEITKVRGNQYVDVQPTLMRKYKTGTLIVMPIIQNVPVSFPRGDDWGFKGPIAIGGKGALHFSQRSLDAWKVKGGTVDPADPRRNDISDAVFYPGLYPMDDQLEGAPDDMIVFNKNAFIVMEKAGKFQIKKDGGEELFDLMSQLVDVLATQTFTLTAIGPQPFIASTVTLLQEIKTKLDGLKGG